LTWLSNAYSKWFKRKPAGLWKPNAGFKDSATINYFLRSELLVSDFLVLSLFLALVSDLLLPLLLRPEELALFDLFGAEFFIAGAADCCLVLTDVVDLLVVPLSWPDLLFVTLLFLTTVVVLRVEVETDDCLPRVVSGLVPLTVLLVVVLRVEDETDERLPWVVPGLVLLTLLLLALFPSELLLREEYVLA
jgi:hypothetical protein